MPTMPVNPAASRSERHFLRVAAWSFTLLLGAMTVSYEQLVRASEARYGLKYGGHVPPRLSKVEALVQGLSEGERYSVYAIGTSRTEEGIRPDVIAPIVGPTFNIGMAGSSLVSGFDTLELLDAHPSLVIVGVCPMDFTAMAVRRGSDVIRASRESIESLHHRKSEEHGLAAATRAVIYTLLHGAAPRRKRNLGQWRERFQLHGELLQFLNNPDAASHPEALWIHGFLGKPDVATAENFVILLPRSTLLEYHDKHDLIYPRLHAAVTRQQRRGTEVVFVRMPIAPVPRQMEDATGFDRDIRAAAARCGVRYIDGNALAGDSFLRDMRNFVDGGHLNVTGATAFSRLLGAALRPARGRPAGNEWPATDLRRRLNPRE